MKEMHEKTFPNFSTGLLTSPRHVNVFIFFQDAVTKIIPEII